MNDKGIERLRELFDQAEAQAQTESAWRDIWLPNFRAALEPAQEKFRLEEGTVAEVAELERKVWRRMKDEG